jgi:hypothetical protein
MFYLFLFVVLGQGPQTGLEPAILLPHLLQCWAYRRASPHPAIAVTNNDGVLDLQLNFFKFRNNDKVWATLDGDLFAVLTLGLGRGGIGPVTTIPITEVSPYRYFF